MLSFSEAKVVVNSLILVKTTKRIGIYFYISISALGIEIFWQFKFKCFEYMTNIYFILTNLSIVVSLI